MVVSENQNNIWMKLIAIGETRTMPVSKPQKIQNSKADFEGYQRHDQHSIAKTYPSNNSNLAWSKINLNTPKRKY